ncbi:TPA: hypothetical protein J1414_004706 [Escherichia coli]|nr:hypothetical protein [Escherichia coli]
MTLKYYIKYFFWGLAGCGYLIYIILTDLYEGKILPAYTPYMPYIAAYLTVSAITLPFSFYVSEQLAMKIMRKESWDNHFGADSPSWSAFIFVYLFCILLSVPLFMLYPFVNKKQPGK